jgi:hypothetical protein
MELQNKYGKYIEIGLAIVAIGEGIYIAIRK